MVSLVGRVFFSCVSVFFSLALSKLAISPMSGLSAIFLQLVDSRSELALQVLPLELLQQETATSVFTELSAWHSGCDCSELRVLSHFWRYPKVTFLSCLGCCWPLPLQLVHFGYPLGYHLCPGSSWFVCCSERTPDISVRQSSSGLCMPAESRSSPALFIAIETGFLSYVAVAFLEHTM